MVDYNNFAKTFSESRKNMKWEEIEYFLQKIVFSKGSRILDIGCGNGRFLSALKNTFSTLSGENYAGIDLSSGLLEEAQKIHPDFGENFSELNMLDIDGIDEKFTDIFFIASYHHLDSFQKREEVLMKTSHLLETGGKIYMTNWALNSELNNNKYKKSLITTLDCSDTLYGSSDFNITIGGNDRYYHCFSIEELEYLATKSGLKIIENRLFDNERNFITILQK